MRDTPCSLCTDQDMRPNTSQRAGQGACCRCVCFASVMTTRDTRVLSIFLVQFLSSVVGHCSHPFTTALPCPICNWMTPHMLDLPTPRRYQLHMLSACELLRMTHPTSVVKHLPRTGCAPTHQ